jgi:hypothetical protein
MKTSIARRSQRLIALALAVSSALPILPASAQQQRAVARPSAAPAKAPLDSLDESQLMSELANRGLNSLLEYYFQKNNIPEDKRKEIVVLIALKHLDSPEFSRKTAPERKKEIDDIVAGINNLLPSITDPQRLLRYAAALISNGTLRLVNVLDYWGDNPKTQAALNPIAETVDKILDRAVTESKTKADAILSQITSGVDPRVQQWEAADQTFKLAEYNRARAAYGLALSYDKAAVAKRNEVAQKAIKTLTEFDEEGSNVRIPVELEIAKLNMAMGPDGYKAAKAFFDKVINAKPDDAKNPKQYLGEQYQAHYFTLVADVLNHDPDAAEKGLADLKAWQEANLPNDKATRLGIDAAYSMLEYRVMSAKAEAAKGPKEKERLNNEAVTILMDLVNKRPDLRSIIFEQVMGKLPDNPELDKLNPLLLEALVTRGIEALQRKTPEKDDAKSIQMAADAARQIVKSKGQPGITAEQVDSSAFRIGVFEEHIASTPQLSADEQFQNKLDAVTAYLQYIEKYNGNKEWSSDALDNALSLLVNVRKTDANNAEINKLYDKALDIALFKLGRTQVAWSYAQRRRELEDFKAARKGYSLVKSDVPIVNVLAKYFEMFCDQQLLDKAPDTDKPALSADVQRLADELNPLIDKSLPTADAATKKQLELTKARMVLLAAAVARANKSPARVVEMLNGYENLLANFDAAMQNSMLGNALFLRVNAMMALGKNTEALAQINNLVARQSPEQSIDTVASLLDQLRTSLLAERGKDNPDPAILTQLSGQQAQLSQLLVEQAQKNNKLPENFRRQALTFNASAQRQAAELETDDAKKKAYLTQALATYDQLLKAVPEPDTKGEKTVLENLTALTEYQVGDPANLQKAYDTFNDLLSRKVLGGPLVRKEDTGESKPNNVYWEASLRLLQSMVKLSAIKNDTAMMDEAKRGLKNLIILNGDQTGGPNFAKDFKQLRKEVLGDWKPDAGPAASQPAAKVQ